MLLRLLNEGISYEQTKDRFLKKLCLKVIRDQTAPQNIYPGNGEDNSKEPSVDFFTAIFHRLWAYDPTHDHPHNPHLYTNWIITQYVNDKIEYWEDFGTVRELLASYDVLKKRQVFQKMAKAEVIHKDQLPSFNDINLIKGKSPLFEIVQMGEKWLKRSEDSSAQEEYQKYLTEQDKNGIQIIYPDGGTPEERFDKFRKYGMVLWLKTMESSITLFEKPTAWCTARGPRNAHFASYTRDGPLIVVVDNANDKLYQFSRATNQFLDEKDSSDFEPATIPFPLIYDAGRACFDADDPKKSTHQLYAELGLYDETMANRKLEAYESGQPVGVVLWKDMLKNPARYADWDLTDIVQHYVADTGRFPPEEEILHDLKGLFGNDDDPSDDFNQAEWLAAAYAFLRHPFLQPPKAVAETINSYRHFNFGELIQLYYNTPMWNRARAQIIERIKAEPGKYYTAGVDHKLWSTGHIPSNRLRSLPGAHTCMAWRSEEIDWLVRTSAELNEFGTCSLYISSYLQRPSAPSPEAIGAAFEIMNKTARGKGIVAQIMPVIVSSAPNASYYDLVDPNFIAHETLGNDQVRPNAIVYSKMAAHGPWREKMNADFFNIALYGQHTIDGFEEMFANNNMREHILSNPALIVACKNAIIRSLQYARGTMVLGYVFQRDEFDPYITLVDLKTIQERMLSKRENYGGLAGPTETLNDFIWMVTRGKTTFPAKAIPEFCLRTLLLLRMHGGPFAHDTFRFLQRYASYNLPIPDWFWHGLFHLYEQIPLRQAVEVGLLPQEKYYEMKKFYDQKSGDEWTDLFRTKYVHHEFPTE